MNDTDQNILCSTETELTVNEGTNVTEIDTTMCTVLESSSNPSNFNYFQKPITSKLEQFFVFHPK